MSFQRHKVTVIGGGFVGSTLAHWIAANQLADVALIDVQGDMAKGKALDLYQAMAVGGQDIQVTGGSDYALAKNSDVVVVTAGIPRKPGMSRDDLLKTNADIMSSVATEIKKNAPDAIVVVVSNPLDAMCHVFLSKSGFESSRVIGMAGILDTARYKTFIAEATGVSQKDIDAIVLGGHGDTMVPLPQHTTLGGVPLSKFLSQEKIDAIVDRTRKGGAEIVGLLQKGSAYYAPSYSAYSMVQSILLDENRILPMSVLCQGEYGIKDLYVGVPAQLGRKGVVKVFELDLNADEKKALENSKNAVVSLVASLKEMKFLPV
jgi:malate dehydrogenase